MAAQGVADLLVALQQASIRTQEEPAEVCHENERSGGCGISPGSRSAVIPHRALLSQTLAQSSNRVPDQEPQMLRWPTGTASCYYSTL